MRRMCAFICSIDDSVWTSVEEEWETPDKALKQGQSHSLALGGSGPP